MNIQEFKTLFKSTKFPQETEMVFKIYEKRIESLELRILVLESKLVKMGQKL